MIASILPQIREAVSQEASIPALRGVLFLFGVLAAVAWARRRPILAVAVLSIGGFLGLSYWLVQVVSPLGLGAGGALSRQWSQAGVNALAEPKGQGFVLGTPAEISLVSSLASVGVPRPYLFDIPQFLLVLFLCLLPVLSRALIRSPSAAAFSAALALGGGLWPGTSPYGTLLLRPSLFAVAGMAAGIVVLIARAHRLRRAFRRSRPRLCLGLMVAVAAVAARAAEGGVESRMDPFLFVIASMMLASPLRAAVHRASGSPVAARRVEALILLAAFSGSGLFWWNPVETVPGFAASRDPGTALHKPMEWIAKNVPADGVILASSSYSAPIAALGGRRVLFPPSVGGRAEEPMRRERLLDTALHGRPVASHAEIFAVTHFFVGPGEANAADMAQVPDDDSPRLGLVLVYQDSDDFRIFRLAKK